MYFMINIRLSRDNMFSIYYSSSTYLLDEIFFWKYTVDFLTAGACIITVYRNCYSDVMRSRVVSPMGCFARESFRP